LGKNKQTKTKLKMKLNTNLIAGAAVLSLLTFTTGAFAQPVLTSTNLLTIKATVFAQGNANNNNSDKDTTSIVAKESITTKQLLGWIAQDENVEGNFNAATFPSGATVKVVADGDGDFDVQVFSKAGVLLVDASDLVTISQGSAVVTSGKVNNTTGFDDSAIKELSLATFTFDDSGLGQIFNGTVGLTVSLTGVQSTTITDTRVSDGSFKQSITATISSGTGQGTLNGSPFIVTGSVSYSEKGEAEQLP
jgi:hypothetical protein